MKVTDIQPIPADGLQAVAARALEEAVLRFAQNPQPAHTSALHTEPGRLDRPPQPHAAGGCSARAPWTSRHVYVHARAQDHVPKAQNLFGAASDIENMLKWQHFEYVELNKVHY